MQLSPSLNFISANATQGCMNYAVECGRIIGTAFWSPDGTESFTEVDLNILPGTEEGNHGPREIEVTLNEKLGILK